MKSYDLCLVVDLDGVGQAPWTASFRLLAFRSAGEFCLHGLHGGGLHPKSCRLLDRSSLASQSKHDVLYHKWHWSLQNIWSMAPCAN